MLWATVAIWVVFAGLYVVFVLIGRRRRARRTLADFTR